MVEDELLDTAKSYTRDLHVAEYHRLKSLAQRKRNEELESIRRSVDGRTPISAEKRVAKLSEEKKKLQVSKGYGTRGSKEEGKDDSDSDDSDMLIGDRNLAGLMLRRKEERAQKPALEPTAKTTPTKPRATAPSAPPRVSVQKPLRHLESLPTTGIGKNSRDDKFTSTRLTSDDGARSGLDAKTPLPGTDRNATSAAATPRANFDEPKARRPIAPLRTRQEPPSQMKRRFSSSSSESEEERASSRQFKRPLKKAAPEEESSRRRIQLDEIPLFLTD